MYCRLRIKRAVALFLCFCTLLICIPYQEVNAKEYEEKYLTIKRVNDGQQGIYQIITDGKEVFISTEQLSKLAGFAKADIVRDGDTLTAVTMSKDEEQDTGQDITISASDNAIYSLRYGEREFDGCLDTGDEVYLNLVDMFNYLRIKAEVIDGRLFINMPEYTMYDFMTVDYPEVLKNCVSQLDLLEPGEDLKSSGNWDALYLACNNFDFRFLVPIWGTNQIKNEQYTKALQTLNEEDETFYDEDTNEYFQSELEGRGLGSCLASGQDLIDALSVGGGAMESAEDVIKRLEGLSETDQDALFSLWDTLNWNREDFLNATGLKTFSDHTGEISDALTVAEIAVSAYEAYEQAASWSEDCRNDLDVLRNLNVDNYGENKDYVKRICKVAEESYQASSDPENAAERQLVSDIADLALEKAITETTVYGKVADLFIFSVNLGVSVARCFGNIAEEMDKGELSYMVSCLINIAVASRIDAEVKRTQLDITDLNLGNQLNDFRNSIRTSIKSNLRCWSYIYYLNSDGTWETSERGQYVKGQIDKMHVYLALLDETKQYDYALDEYDLITYSPERIVEITEKSIPINSNEFWMDFLETGDYAQYIDEEWTDSPLEYVLYDINGDGILELLIQATRDMPFFNTWLFTIDAGKAVLVNEQYGYGEYRYSPEYKAILISGDFKPFMDVTVLQEFCKLAKTEFVTKFVVATEHNNTEAESYYFEDETGRKVITQEERDKYFSEIILFEWKTLEEAGNFGTDQQSSSGNEMTNFGNMAGEYILSSGAGAWATIVNLNSDGSFTGEYHDSDAGDTGDGYVNGTRYICNFHGNFSSLDQIDSYSYSMRLENLEMENEPGKIYYENNMRYICSEPYGFDEAGEFVIYTPGMQIASLPEDFVTWLSGIINVQDTSILPCYGIYNVNAKLGFVQYE